MACVARRRERKAAARLFNSDEQCSPLHFPASPVQGEVASHQRCRRGCRKNKNSKKSVMSRAPARLLFLPSCYFFLFIYIYILHAHLFRRGADLFCTTLTHFYSPPCDICRRLSAIFVTLCDISVRQHLQITADWLLSSGIQVQPYQVGLKY